MRNRLALFDICFFHVSIPFLFLVEDLNVSLLGDLFVVDRKWWCETVNSPDNARIVV